MEYLTQLDWIKNLEGFEPNEQKVLLALSNEQYKWRTRDRLIEVTGLSGTGLDSILSKLISQNVIRPSISKQKKVIVGLTERVR